MLNAHSRSLIDASTWKGPFIRPRYDAYCFANLPSAIERALTGKGETALPAQALAGMPAQPDAVILLFLDAFGWRFFERYRERSAFLKHFMGPSGVASTMTSMFPSTTSAHVTAIHTGLAPGASGVYEWFMNEDSLDATIVPLPFCFAGDRARDTLLERGFTADRLFPPDNLYRRLQKAGVDSYVFHPSDYSRGATGKWLYSLPHVVDYKVLPEALVKLERCLSRQRQRSYYFLYYPELDTLLHQYGPDTDEVDALAEQLFFTLERFFERLAGRHPNTWLLVTADHGQTAVDPKTCLYLNERVPGMARWMRTRANGEPIWPSGSARDTFWHLKPERVDEAAQALAGVLEGRAEVIRTSALMEQGFFGPVVGDVFRARVGELTILPYARETVWWKVPGVYEQRLLGHHGGLTRDEMEIPLLACAL